MSFANRLKQARKRANLTQEQLGKRSGLSTYTIQRYEYGKLNPKKETVAKLAETLGLAYDYTNSGEPYFYTFVDTVTTSEYADAEKFNQEQYQDAIENALEDTKSLTEMLLNCSVEDMQNIFQKDERSVLDQQQQNSESVDPQLLKSIVSSAKEIQQVYGSVPSIPVSLQKDIAYVQKALKSYNYFQKKLDSAKDISADSTETLELSLSDVILLNVFHKLNERGQNKIIAYLDDIAGNPNYINDSIENESMPEQEEEKK